MSHFLAQYPTNGSFFNEDRILNGNNTKSLKLSRKCFAVTSIIHAHPLLAGKQRKLYIKGWGHSNGNTKFETPIIIVNFASVSSQVNPVIHKDDHSENK